MTVDLATASAIILAYSGAAIPNIGSTNNSSRPTSILSTTSKVTALSPYCCDSLVIVMTNTGLYM